MIIRTNNIGLGDFNTYIGVQADVLLDVNDEIVLKAGTDDELRWNRNNKNRCRLRLYY